MSAPDEQARSSWPTWRLAARLARREVRRRPGRTLLVMLLVALPVAGMTVAEVVYRTENDPGAGFAQRFGNADIAVAGQADTTAGLNSEPDAGAVDIRPIIPSGSQTVEFHTISGAALRSPDGTTATAEFSDVSLDSTSPEGQLAAGIFELDQGRAPKGNDEAVLSPGLAKKLNVQVGDDVTLERPDGTFHVVGVGQYSAGLGSDAMVVGSYPFDDLAPWNYERTILIGTPELSEVATRQLASQLEEVAPPSQGVPRVSTPDSYFSGTELSVDSAVSPIAFGWAIGVVGLVAVGIIIAAAFATSARRQLITLGQLSANGADGKLLRRTLAMQGAWSGLAGSVVGMFGGFALLLLVRRPVESLLLSRVGSLQFSFRDLVVILATGTVASAVAAYVPARTVARVPVLKALAGRRPLGTVPRWMVPIGAVMFGAGALLLAAATSMPRGVDNAIQSLVAALGGISLLAGACFVSPALVGALGPLGERTSGVTKLAARGLARARTRSAAVVTAIAVAGAVAIASSTVFDSTASGASAKSDDSKYLADNVIVVSSDLSGDSSSPLTIADAEERFVEIPPEVRNELKRIVPGVKPVPLRSALYAPPANDQDERSDALSRMLVQLPTPMLIADEQVVDSLNLSDRDARALRSSGTLTTYVLSAQPQDGITAGDDPTSANVSITTDGGQGSLSIAEFQDPVSNENLMWSGWLITQEAAAQAGLPVFESGLVAIAPDPLTDGQKEQLQNYSSVIGGSRHDPFASPQQSIAPDSGLRLDWAVESFTLQRSTAQSLIVGFAALLALGVVAIGLALAAAEGRSERDVLVAVGAKPGAMSRFAGAKAWWLTVLGGALAVPLGFVPIAAWISATDGSDPLRFPWTTAAFLVVATPLFAALMAWLGSTTTQRIRPIHMSNLAVD